VDASAIVLGADPLAFATATGLRDLGVDVLAVRGEQLPELCVSLRPGGFAVEGRRIGAILLREMASAIAPRDFAPDDRGFVHAELSATWLAATQLDGMLVVNRLDAEAWFEGAQWPVWRRRLTRGAVGVSPLSFGDRTPAACWRPYVDGLDRPVPIAAARRALGTALAHAPKAGRALFACGDAIGERPPAAVEHAARLLCRQGVQVASFTYDADGCVATVDVLPALSDVEVDDVAPRLIALLHDHLRRR
jgi:hypothetical protein